MSIRDKAAKKACWESRDRYWHCLDSKNDPNVNCEEIRRTFESLCPQQWVRHFARKREYLKFKERIHKDQLTETPAVASCSAMGNTEVKRRHRPYGSLVSS